MKIYPDAYLKNVEQITIDFLKTNNIKALILDIDNTLIDYNKNLSKSVIEWVETLKKEKIKLHILSNTNNKEKVEKVAKKLDIEYSYLAKKPLKKGFLRAKEILKEDVENIGVVGDQIFTDVIGGNRCNMFTILVDPVDKKDYWYTAWKRPIENKIKQRYQNKRNNK